LLGNIKEIIITKNNMLSTTENFILKIEDGKNTIEYSYSNKKSKCMYCSNELTLTFLDKLFRITDSWNEKYINNSILDGMEWRIIIKFKNEKFKSFSGKNDYPNNFEALDEIMKELANKIEDPRV
jgi:hypothetical protein